MGQSFTVVGEYFAETAVEEEFGEISINYSLGLVFGIILGVIFALIINPLFGIVVPNNCVKNAKNIKEIKFCHAEGIPE